MNQEQLNYESAQKAIKDGNFSIALTFMDKVIEENQTNPIYYATRAGIYNCLLRYEDGILDAQESIKLDYNFVRSHMQEGYANFHLKKYKHALRSYIKAQKIDPDNSMLQELIRKVNKKLQEQHDVEDVENQFEEDWLKETVTKLAIDPKYKICIDDPKFIFKLELIHQSPQLTQILCKSDYKLRQVLDHLNLSETNVTAQNQEQKEQFKPEEMQDLQKDSEQKKKDSENQQKSSESQLLQTTQGVQIKSQNASTSSQQVQSQNTKTQKPDIEKIISENSQKQEKNKQEANNQFGSLENMENVFSSMAMEMKRGIVDDPLSDLFSKMKTSFQVPGNSLQKENEIQTKIRYDIKNQLNLGSSGNEALSGSTSTEQQILPENAQNKQQQQRMMSNYSSSANFVQNTSNSGNLSQNNSQFSISNSSFQGSTGATLLSQNSENQEEKSMSFRELMNTPFKSTFMPNNIDREVQNIQNVQTQQVQQENNSINNQHPIQQKSSNMVSISQSFDLNTEILKQQKQMQENKLQSTSITVEQQQQKPDQQPKKKKYVPTISASTTQTIAQENIDENDTFEKNKKTTSSMSFSTSSTQVNDEKNEEKNQQIKSQLMQQADNINNDTGICFSLNPKKNSETKKKNKENITYAVKTVGTEDFKNSKSVQDQKNQQLLVQYKKEGENQLYQKNYGKAVVNFNKALQIDSSDLLLYVLKVNALIGIGNFIGGHECVDEKIMKIVQDDQSKIAIANQLKALLYEHQKNYDMAQLYYQKSYDLNPSRNLQLQLQHINKQIQNSQVYDKNPNVKKAAQISASGDSLFAVGKFEYALEEFNKALELEEEQLQLAELYVKISNCQIKLKDLQKGLQSLDNSLKLNSQKVSVWVKKGYIHIFLKEYRMAQASFELGLDLDQENPDLLKGLERAKDFVAQQEQEKQEKIQRNKTQVTFIDLIKKSLVKLQEDHISYLQNDKFNLSNQNENDNNSQKSTLENAEIERVLTISKRKEFEDQLKYLLENPDELPKILDENSQLKQVIETLKNKNLLQYEKQ